MSTDEPFRTDYEMLTAFLELERITHELAVSALLGDDTRRKSGSLIEED
jgi:hypothetical protein